MLLSRPRRRVSITVVAALCVLLAACTGPGGSSVSSAGSTDAVPGSPTGPNSSLPAVIVTSAPPTAGSQTSSGSATQASGSATGTGVPAVGPLGPDQYSVLPITDAHIQLAVGSIDGIADDVMRRTHIPGMAIAVVHAGKIVYAKGFGVRQVGKPDKIDPDTVFQIASLSKSVGATVVARAVGQHTVAWSDPVIKYLPHFVLSDPAVTKMVTIGDLYAHRSGIPGAAGDDLEGLGFSRGQIIEKLRLFRLNPFRVTYGYSNFGMTTGAEAVSRAAHTSWEKLSDQLLYRPLGMASTSSTYADYLKRPDRAAIHAKIGKDFQAKYVRDADAQSPAGGVSSSVMDLSKWMMMNLAAGRVGGRQLIDPSALLQAHSAQIVNNPAREPDARSRYYGYGFNVETTSSGQVRWGHSGAFYVGAGTAYGMLPAGDVGIVVLTNAAPVGAAEAVSVSFTDLARTGRVERDWLAWYGPQFDSIFVNHSPVAAKPKRADPAHARNPAAYVGTYSNEFFGDVQVTAAGGVLSVEIGPKHQKAAIAHYNGDVYSWLPPGGNGDPLTAVTFAGNLNGRAKTVTLEYIDTYQFGTFTRR